MAHYFFPNNLIITMDKVTYVHVLDYKIIDNFLNIKMFSYVSFFAWLSYTYANNIIFNA